MAALSLPRVLCVDSDPALLRNLERAFRAYGCEVSTASYGIDAFMQFRGVAGSFDAILVDHDAARLTGVSFVRRLRGLGYPGCILVMARHLSVTEARFYHELMVTGFFRKPFAIDMAVTLLVANMSNRRAPRPKSQDVPNCLKSPEKRRDRQW